MDRIWKDTWYVTQTEHDNGMENEWPPGGVGTLEGREVDLGGWFEVDWMSRVM